MLVRVPATPQPVATVRRTRSPWTRWAVLALVFALLPVPWQHRSNSSLGFAWGLDNRLVLAGERLDPPGRWSWLTVGRPTLVGELAWQQARALVEPDTPPVARDLRVGEAAIRPAHAEPMAAAVGLAAAGQATYLPDGGLAPADAVLGGEGPPYSWVRSLSMGSSHGLMVALVTYATVADEDLAAGRHVAGTGELAADGSVGMIGGLAAKALGARRAGADVLLVPRGQAHELDGLDLGAMQVLAVTSLDDAIVQLRASRPALPR